MAVSNLQAVYGEWNIATIYTFLLGLITVSIYLFFSYKKNEERIKFAKKLPGPATIPIFGNMLLFLNKEEIYLKLLKYSIQYNFQPYRLWSGNNLFIVLTEPDDFEDIFHTSKLLEKASPFSEGMKLFYGDGLICGPEMKWKMARKLLQPSLVANGLVNYMPAMKREVDAFIETVSIRVDKEEFDIGEYMSSLFLNIIGRSYYEVDVEKLQEDGAKFHPATKKSLDYVMGRTFLPDWYMKITQNLFSTKINRITSDLNFMVKALIKEHEADYLFNDQDCHRYLDSEECTSINDDDKGKFKKFMDCIRDRHFSPKYRTDEVITMTTGGIETGAVTMSFLFLVLGIFQDIQEKVYNELIDVFGLSNRSVEIEDLKNLVYLERVINEVLRCFPIVPFCYRQTTEEIKIGRYTIPKDVCIAINIMGANNNPKYFPNPKKFNPDNFLEENVQKRHKYAFIPFSAGSRNCIGKAFVMMEMKSVASTFLRRYKVYSTTKWEDIRLSVGFVLSSANSYKIRITERK